MFKMQHLEVGGAVRPLWWPLGVKGLRVLAVGLWSHWEGVLEGQQHLTIQVYCKLCDIVIFTLAGLKRRQNEKLLWL
jgi:hypothetical protein